MADDLPPDLAARYPSIANGGKAPARAVVTPSKAPAPESQSTATAEERMAKRYPSIANGGKAVKVDRPAAGRGGPVEAPAPAVPDRKLTASEWQDREAERLAKRYPSIRESKAATNRTGAADQEDAEAPVGEVPVALPPPAWAKDLDYLDHTSTTFQAFAKEAARLGLDDKGRRAIADLYRQDREAQRAATEAESDRWRAEVERDREVMANVAATRALVREYGGKEFSEALGPLGNHPVIVRTLTRIAMELEAARKGGGYR